MTLFTVSAVSSRWNDNRQEPETPLNDPMLLHFCLSVCGENHAVLFLESYAVLLPRLLSTIFQCVNATSEEEI